MAPISNDGIEFGRSRWAQLAVAVLATLAGVLTVAPGASAAPKLVDLGFDELAPGVRISTQYESQGVVFGEATPYNFEVGEPKDNVVSRKADCPAPISREASATHSPPIFAGNYCGEEFGPAGTFAAMSSFAKEVSAYVGDAGTAHVPFRLDAYDAEHHLIGHSEVTSSSAAVDTQIRFVAKSYEIAFFALYRTEPDLQSFTVGFDDLTFEVGEAPPEITLSASASGEIAQGGSIKHTVTVLRDNGSEGNVRLKASGLPPGVTATFEPEVLTGKQTTSELTLQAEDAAPLGEATGAIEATPQTVKAGAAKHAVPLHLAVVPPFSVYAGLASSVPAFTSVQLPPCSSASVAVRTVLEPGFPGPVDLAVSNPAAGGDLPVTALEDTTLEGSDFDIAGVNEQRLTITRNGAGPAAGATDVQVVPTSGPFAEPPAHVIVERVPPTISTILPTSGHTPRRLLGGSEVTLTGAGFCPGSTVRFGNADAVAPASSVNSGGTVLKAFVPRLATSGSVTVSSGGATQTAPTPMTIDSYRNVNGYQFHNYPPYVTFSQLTEAFGPEQTEIKIDLCWPFGCDIKIPSPIALIVQAIADNGLNSGACFGISLSSQRLLEGYKQLNELPPGNATSIFGLSEHGGPSPELTNFINARHVSQLSTEFLSHFFGTEVEQGASGGVSMAQKVFAEIEEAFSRGEYPLVALEEGGRGHLVIAYDLEGSPGDYYIDVYDSNDPFGWEGGEEGEENAAHHQANVLSSRVHIGSDGEWELPSTGIHGGVTGLVVTDPGSFPTRPSMIGGPGPVGYLFTSNSAAGGSAPAMSAITQLEDPAGHKLLTPGGQPNPNPATRPDAVQFAPVVGAGAGAGASATASQSYVISGKEPGVTEKVTGTGSGNDTHTMIGAGFAAQTSTSASKGIENNLSFSPSSPRVAFTTAASHKPVSLTLVHGLSKEADVVTIATTSFAGKGDALTLSGSGNGFTLQHHGAATTFSITLSALGPRGAPALFQSGPLRIGAGASASVSSISWSTLASAHLRVRIGSRVLVIRNRARGARPASVRALTAHRLAKHGVALTINASSPRPQKGAKLAYLWVVRRGHRVLATHATLAALSQRTATYTFRAPTRGSYVLTGSVAVITQNALASATSTSSRRLAFRAG